MNYKNLLESLQSSIDDNFDLAIEKNDILSIPPPLSIISVAWPAQIHEFYSQLNGYELYWFPIRQQDYPFAKGLCKILSAEIVAGNWEGIVYFENTLSSDPNIEHFRIIDFFTDEAVVGFYDMPGSSGEMHLYLFENIPIPLGIGFDAYVKLLCESHAFFYWQNALLAIKNGKENMESRDLQKFLPKLVKGFSFEKFKFNYLNELNEFEKK
jgi:hypothetical protein